MGNTTYQPWLGGDGLTAAEAAAVRLAAPQFKTPIPLVPGASLSAADFTSFSGSPTITLEAGPNGSPAVKIVTGAGTNAEVLVPPAIGLGWRGDAYMTVHGGSIDKVASISLYASQNDTSYANGIVQTYAPLAAPLDASTEQGGAYTIFFSKAGHINFGSPTYPMKTGQVKIRVTPVSGQVATVWIYALSFAAPANKSRLCVTFDDGYKSSFDYGYDIFASAGIRTTFGLIPVNVGTATYVNLNQLRSYVDGGNACVAHGPNTGGGAGNLFSAYPGDTSAQLADMLAAVEWIRSNGLGVKDFEKCYVWPQGRFQSASNNLDLLNAAHAAGFTIGRNVGLFTSSPFGAVIPAMSKYGRFACRSIGHLWAGTTAAEATNITNITNAIAGAADTGTDAFLMLHRVLPASASDATMGAANAITIRDSDLQTIVTAISAQIATGKMECVTMPELARSTWWGQF